MRIKKLFFLIIFCILIIYFFKSKKETNPLIFSCTKVVHDTTVIHDTTIIHDTIIKNIALGFLWSWGWQRAYLYTYPLPNPESSDAKLIWEGNVRQFPFKYLRPGYLFFYDTIELIPKKLYSLKITSNIGICSGAVRIPESTYFTQPREHETLPARSSATIAWTIANYADFYWLYIWITGVDYRGEIVYETEIDTFLTTTSYIIPASYFSEPNALYFEVDVDVTPLSGVYPMANNEGNMEGDIVGYLTGEGESDWIYFYVGTPLYKKFKFKNKEDIRKKLENNYINLVKTIKSH